MLGLFRMHNCIPVFLHYNNNVTQKSFIILFFIFNPTIFPNTFIVAFQFCELILQNVILQNLFSLLYRPGSRKWWRGIPLQYRRVDKAPGWQKGRKSGGLVKSPVIKLACSDLQHTRIGDHRVKDEVARCKLRRLSDWRSPEQAHRQRWRWCRLWRRPARPQGRCMKAP